MLEEPPRPLVLRSRRPAESHHDSLQIADLLQFRGDSLHGRSLELRIQGRQHQPDRLVPRETLQIPLEPLNLVRLESMQSGYDTGLIEIRHGPPPGASFSLTGR